jgi:glucosamine--fructose-6-phosphate aminotransferase (isomerizing)
MRTEIEAQPAAVAGTLAAVAGTTAALAAAIRARDIDTVVLVARGTSDNAATYARYLLEARCGLIATLAAPSLYTTYRAPIDLRRAVVVGVSQSGETPEIVAAMAYARERGALTAGLTNGAGSPLVAAVEHPLVTAAGVERSVAATKTFTAQLAAIASLARALGASGLERLDDVPGAMAATLAMATAPAEAAAEPLAYATAAVCVARGLAYTVALEAALKLKETTGVWAEGFSAADLRHGPKAAVAALPAIVFHAGGPLEPDVAGLERELGDRGARIIAVGPGQSLPTAAVSEELAAFTLVLPAQVLAERLARLRGRDPDAPPGLTKVTATH